MDTLEILGFNKSIDHIVCNQNLYFEIRTKLNLNYSRNSI